MKKPICNCKNLTLIPTEELENLPRKANIESELYYGERRRKNDPIERHTEEAFQSRIFRIFTRKD